MSKLSLQPLLCSNFARRRFLLRPTEPDWQDLIAPAHDSIYFGSSQALNVPVYWNYKRLINPHVAVVGMTGSGKSFFVKSFISRASVLWNTNSLILDWSNEYTPWVNGVGGTIIDFTKGISLNILDCRYDSETSDITPLSHIDWVLNAICVSCSLSNDSQSKLLIKSALKSAYKKFGIDLNSPISKSKKKLPSVVDVFDILSSAPASSSKNRVILAFEKLCSQNSLFLSTKNSLNLNSLTNHGLCSINLSALPSDEHRSLVALLILQFLKEKMRTNQTNKTESPRFIVVVDEAWKIAQDENSDLVQILREGRKYSFSLVVASQNPTDISKTILSNCATLLVFRLLHHEFRASLLSSLNLHANFSASIEGFPIGRALCRFALKDPWCYDGPFIISKIDGQLFLDEFIVLVDNMQIKISKKDISKNLWGVGLSSSQVSSICSQFEQSSNQLTATRLVRILLSFGLSKNSIRTFLRNCAFSESQILTVFSNMDSVDPLVSQSLVDLVVSDEKRI